MKNLMNKLGLGLMGLMGLVVAGNVHAAPDADLVAGLASSTAIFQDNKSTIIGYAVAVILVVTVITLVIRALFFGKGLITSVFGGRRRKR